ncbi:MAG: hypothetical protein OXF02_07325 [Simkaniaceae bacterium]|nr:hypothetical protein [Simkaniaceae bacterium]
MASAVDDKESRSLRSSDPGERAIEESPFAFMFRRLGVFRRLRDAGSDEVDRNSRNSLGQRSVKILSQSDEERGQLNGKAVKRLDGNTRKPGRPGKLNTGRPPFRSGPVSGRVRKLCTKGERSALVDYVLEQRETKSVAECATECGVDERALERWIRAECATHPVIVALGLDYSILWGLDYVALLTDLRAGKNPVLSDYFKK